jgi:hypothetical protein
MNSKQILVLLTVGIVVTFSLVMMNMQKEKDEKERYVESLASYASQPVEGEQVIDPELIGVIYPSRAGPLHLNRRFPPDERYPYVAIYDIPPYLGLNPRYVREPCV